MVGFFQEGCLHGWWRTEKQITNYTVKTAAQLKLRFSVKNKQGFDKMFMFVVVVTKFSN